MPSPFPGMNPYLEQNDTWEEFHNSFIVHAQGLLTPQVGENYIVKVEVRLLLHERSAEERRFFGISDIGLSRLSSTEQTPQARFNAPMSLELPAVVVEKHLSLEIRDRRNRRVVTVLELLSPSNKSSGADRDDYLAKRRQVLASSVHLVEIDLRRGGQRPAPPELPRCDYYALVSRYEDRPHVAFWPFALRDPLPDVPIPLDSPDPPIHLDLKAALDRAYDMGDYGKYIYDETPEPPLSADEEAWARAIVSVER